MQRPERCLPLGEGQEAVAKHLVLVLVLVFVLVLFFDLVFLDVLVFMSRVGGAGSP